MAKEVFIGHLRFGSKGNRQKYKACKNKECDGKITFHSKAKFCNSCLKKKGFSLKSIYGKNGSADSGFYLPLSVNIKTKENRDTSKDALRWANS